MLDNALTEDALLVADADAEELESLVRDHARLVYQVVYSVLRHHHDAEDALQETFLRVVRYRKRLPAVRDRRAWLARIAWRVALDRRKRPAELPWDEVARPVRERWAAATDLEQLAGSEEMAGLLERLIASLPRDLREPLLLSTVEEMTAAEIAAALEIPEASVRTRVFRARQLLREKLSSVLGGRHGR